MWRDVDTVETHQCAHGRGDDSGGPGETDTHGNVRMVLQREVAWRQLNPLLPGVVQEALDRGLYQAQAAVIAVEPHVLRQLLQGGKIHAVLLAGGDIEEGGFVAGHPRRKVAQDDRDGLAEVPIRGVADQAGPTVRAGFNNQGILAVQAPWELSLHV